MSQPDFAFAVGPQLREREHECEVLGNALAAAARGAGSIVAVEGEAGIGKTTLLAHAVRRASDSGMRVLDARGRELERDVAYGVVRQLFASVLATATSDEHARWLAGAASLAAPAIWGENRPGAAAATAVRSFTGCTGCRRISPPSGRLCWCSMTRSGLTEHRSPSCRT